MSKEHVDTAAEWFVRLQDEAENARTFVEWQHWLASASEHREAYESIENIVLRLKRLPAAPALPSEQEMAADTYDGTTPIMAWKARRGGVRTHHYGISASVALIAVLGAWGGLQHVRDSWLMAGAQLGSFTYRTAPGQRDVVTLADGSKVTLDANSVLQVEMKARHRDLRLEQGEGYFQVVKDTTRPFTVRAGATQVTAVGTAFNVRLSENRTVVAVTEGKVEVVAGRRKAGSHPDAHRSPGSSSVNREPARDSDSTATAGTAGDGNNGAIPRFTAQVAAGEAVAYVDDGNLRALPTEEASLATAWLQGQRQYRNEPLRYVLADIDRYTGRRISVADEATGNLRFTGTLNLQNSDAWLRGLPIALPVTVTQHADGSLSIAQSRSEP